MAPASTPPAAPVSPPSRDELEARIRARLDALPPRLRAAARHLLANPADVAMCSMRTIAQRAGVPHVTMIRLARQLDLPDYDALRDIYRHWLGSERPGLSTRARALQADASRQAHLLDDMIGADVELLRRLGQDAETTKALTRAARRILDARRCYVLGLRSLFAPAHYLGYTCGQFLPHVSLVTGLGGLRSDELRHVGAADALVAFSAAPYAQDTLAAVDQARDAGAAIVAITDSPASPIARGAAATLLFGNDSPSLFPSIVPAVALAQSLTAMLIATGDARVVDAIADSEQRLSRFYAAAARR